MIYLIPKNRFTLSSDSIINFEELNDISGEIRSPYLELLRMIMVSFPFPFNSK